MKAVGQQAAGTCQQLHTNIALHTLCVMSMPWGSSTGGGVLASPMSVPAIAGRSHPSTRGGFHYYELFLGFLLASGLAALAQWRFNFIHFRSLSRKQKGEAIQVLHRAVWGNLLLAAAGGGRAGMPPRMPKRHAQQS